MHHTMRVCLSVAWVLRMGSCFGKLLPAPTTHTTRCVCRTMRACEQTSQYSTELSSDLGTPAPNCGGPDALLTFTTAGENAGPHGGATDSELPQGSPLLSPSGRWVPGHFLVRGVSIQPQLESCRLPVHAEKARFLLQRSTSDKMWETRVIRFAERTAVR